MSPKLARLLIKFYSSEWRARYGEEFAIFLEDSPVSAKIVLDVVRMGIRESSARWLRRRAEAFRGVVLSRPARATSMTLGLGAIMAFILVAEATPLLAMHRSGETFLTCSSDARIRYEPSAAQVASVAADVLPQAIEETHSRAFLDPSFSLYIVIDANALKISTRARQTGDKPAREFIYFAPQSVGDPAQILTTLEDHLRRLKKTDDGPNR